MAKDTEYSVQTIMNRQFVGSGTVPVSGQLKIANTGTAVNFPDKPLNQGAIITNNSSANAIVIGPSGVTNTADGTGNGVVVAAGASIGVAVSNMNLLYLNGTANDWVSYIGS